MIGSPESFSLIEKDNRNQLIIFLNTIKENLKKGFKVHLIFNKTKRLHPCGMLYAVSNIESLLETYPKTISCGYPRDDVVEQLFQHIGFLKLLGKTECRKIITADNVRYWHYVNGISTDDVSKFKELIQSINFNEDIQSGLFESMSEAVTNTIQHAYEGTKPKKWWMFAQNKNSLLEIAICDLGIGIPKSLRRKPELKERMASTLHRIKNRRDTVLIEVATGSNRSSTQLSHRGHGLKDMLEFVKTNEIGGFRIFSAKGAFNYSSSNKQVSRKDYPNGINGTIVQWQIPVERNNED